MPTIEVRAALRFKSGAARVRALAAFDEYACAGSFTHRLWRQSGTYARCRASFEAVADRDYQRAFFELAQHATDGAIYMRVSGDTNHYRITKQPRKPWQAQSNELDGHLFGLELAACEGRWAQ